MVMTTTYTSIQGMLLHENREGVEAFYVPDTQGSLMECRSASGVKTYEAEYWPYGEVRTSTGSNPSPWNFVGLLGYFRDIARLLYVRDRHYRPDLARWQTVDPLWPEESAYGYVGGNPVARVDPSGTGAFLVVAIGVIVVVTAQACCAYKVFVDVQSRLRTSEFDPRNDFMVHCIASCLARKVCHLAGPLLWLGTEITGHRDWRNVMANMIGEMCGILSALATLTEGLEPSCVRCCERRWNEVSGGLLTPDSDDKDGLPDARPLSGVPEPHRPGRPPIMH